MIRLQDICQTLSEIKEQIEDRVLHPYLLKYIQNPYIDEDKLLLLISLLDQLGLSAIQIQNYALTTMLIQIALDTHEHVSNNMIQKEEKFNLTNRQLTVLAGDYYSGLYYRILAYANDISMIKVLAHGIKEVNEHKILVYQKEFDEIEKLMTSMKNIESSLFANIIKYFEAYDWAEFVANLLLVKRLLNEKKQYVHDGSSPLFEALKTIFFKKNAGKSKELTNEQQGYLLNVCDHYIEFSKNIVQKGIQKLPPLNNLLKERVFSIVN